MATIKSFTDISQSKKLAEILPIESADMYWRSLNLNGHISWSSHFKRLEPPIYDLEHYIPCWSLAALLGILPSYEINNFGNDIQLDVKNEAFVTEGDETLLDLVVNMIIHLHELKML